MKQALTGRDLTVYGDGSQTRSFCYVDDMVDGPQALLKSDVDEPVNVWNPDERTIKELAGVIIDLTDSDSGITYEELPPQDPQVRRPDITKAKTEGDWTPSADFRNGLERSVEYFSKRV